MYVNAKLKNSDQTIGWEIFYLDNNGTKPGLESSFIA